jgi:hypothetical protein
VDHRRSAWIKAVFQMFQYFHFFWQKSPEIFKNATHTCARARKNFIFKSLAIYKKSGTSGTSGTDHIHVVNIINNCLVPDIFIFKLYLEHLERYL